MIEIHSLTFEHHRDSLGIGEATPRLSWKFKGDSKNWVQSSYHIEISSAALDASNPQTFHVDSCASVLVPWPTAPLRSRQRVTVRVRAHGSDGGESTSWSEPATVEVGLLFSKDWTAALVEAPRILALNDSIRPSLFRKAFKIDKKVASARIYMTTHGIYEAHLNGTRIGDHVFAPGWTSYNHQLNYQTYDVTKLLREGVNVIVVEVGEGWFCTRLGFGGGQRNIYADQLALLFQLEVQLQDGKSISVNSDKTWRTGNGPILASEIYDGEIYDASLVENWHSTTFNDRSWPLAKLLKFPTAQLLASKGPPVRRLETVKPQKIFKSPTGKTIVDFGQNLVGWAQVRVSGTKGDTIDLTHTEVLEDGECATRPLRDCKAKDTLILSGKCIQWEPKFTFHGFRYAQVEGWPSGSREPSFDDISAVVLHTDMERTGFFECSNSMINKLHENIRWGMRGNFLSIPTDCPQRDERLGWTGDIQIFSPTANFLYNTAGMLSGWLQDLAAEQLSDYNGVPPLVCPNVIKDPFPKTQAAWADVVVILPFDLYNAFGDRKILLDQYHSMKTWISKALPRGPNGLWDPNTHQLGDWLDPAAPPDEPGNGRTDPHLVANAYLIRITDIIAKVSKILDLHDDHTHYTTEAVKIRKAFQDEYITPAGRLAPDTMTSLSLALCYNLFRTPHEGTYAATRLAKLVRSSSFKIATGFVGTPLILPALTAAGYPQLAYRMLHETKCPSWLYPLTMGATTMWERWDSMLPDGRVNPGSMTSFNHYALGSVGAWLHGSVGGLQAGEAGWRRVVVRPVPGGEVTWARCVFEGPYGRVRCEWKVQEGTFWASVEVPPNSTAEVLLPGKDGWVVGSGIHEFEMKYVEPEWPPTAQVDPFSS
jgi:alpha-L-rhamnosidase